MKTPILLSFLVTLSTCSSADRPVEPGAAARPSLGDLDSMNALLNAHEDAHAEAEAWKRLDPMVRTVLARLLADPTEAVTRRARAAEGLSFVAGPLELALIDRMAGDGSLHRLIRMGCVSSLAQAEQAAAVPRLIELLADPEPGVRARSIDALSRLANPAALAALSRVRRAGPVGDRLRVARALSQQ